MIPILCVILFFILGLWILTDPLPGVLLLNFPEIIGRLVVVFHYYFVTQSWLMNLMISIAPLTSVVVYFRLIAEMEDMQNTPLANLPLEDD